jgi:hypothetical protein
MGRSVAWGLVWAAFACPVAAQEESRPGLRAGAAASNVTPFLGEPIVGNWDSPPAAHIHDELHARCLALDDGRTRLLFVVCDNVGVSREVFDEARGMIEKETGVPGAHVLLSSTHTHSATSARGRGPLGGGPLSDYGRFLARRIADAARRALNNLEPARIAWGSVQAPEHLVNRRYFMKPGVPIPNPFGGEDRVLMNPGVGNPDVDRPAGPVDPELAFLSVRARDGRPLALLAAYSLHYVGGVPAGHVSADYFGVFAERVGELLGASRHDRPFVGILANGTSGDVNNIDVLGKPERLPPYEKMRRVADALAEKVAQAERELVGHDRVVLGARMRDLVLRVRKPTAEQLARAREVLARPPDVKPRHPREAVYARRALELSEAPDEVSVPLQAVRVGDVGIAAVPFEVFAEIGLELKRRIPLPRRFTISLANGSYGYLPTPEQHALGGYETWLGTNRVEVEASVKIVEALLGLFEELRGGR